MSQVSNDNIFKGADNVDLDVPGVENKRTCNCSQTMLFQAWNVLGHSLSWAHLNRWIPNGSMHGV
jgi:hypothetical protein